MKIISILLLVMFGALDGLQASAEISLTPEQVFVHDLCKGLHGFSSDNDPTYVTSKLVIGLTIDEIQMTFDSTGVIKLRPFVEKARPCLVVGCGLGEIFVGCGLGEISEDYSSDHNNHHGEDTIAIVPYLNPSFIGWFGGSNANEFIKNPQPFLPQNHYQVIFDEAVLSQNASVFDEISRTLKPGGVLIHFNLTDSFNRTCRIPLLGEGPRESHYRESPLRIVGLLGHESVDEKVVSCNGQVRWSPIKVSLNKDNGGTVEDLKQLKDHFRSLDTFAEFLDNHRWTEKFSMSLFGVIAKPFEDGTYPQGLEDRDVPYGIRVTQQIRIADALDAIMAVIDTVINNQ